ncbi:MAG: hypothetical protein KKF48_05630 [Nanoarchaeota archaeon]|nr:hypothetical protein [Nanoarchaeota archaeon]MBU1028498.1 hypothetical protein [Nanoarchaeota archaeon]
MGLSLEKVSGKEIGINDQVLVDSGKGYEIGYVTSINDNKIKVDERPKDPNNMKTFLLSFIPGSNVTPFARGVKYDLDEVELYKLDKN